MAERKGTTTRTTETTVEMMHSTKLGLAEARALRKVFGREGLRYAIDLARPEVTAERQAKNPKRFSPSASAVDKVTFKNLPKVYGLKKGTDPESFYMAQLKQADQVIEQAIIEKAVPSMVNDIGLINDETFAPDRPSERLRLLFTPDSPENPNEGVDEKLKFEVRRQLILADVSAKINARSLNGRLRTKLSELNEFLHDKGIYEGKRGHSEKVKIASYHDPVTNETLGHGKVEEVPPSDVLVKHHTYRARFVPNIDSHVLTQPRKKDDAVAIIKTLQKARASQSKKVEKMLNKGIRREDMNIVANIDALKASKDTAGIMFITLKDGKETRDAFVETVENALKQFPGKLTVKEDDSVGNDRTQSQKVEFKRRQVGMPGMKKAPIELMFFTPKDYWNSRYETGIEDPKKGTIDGQGHRIYEMTRILDVVEDLFPPTYYPTAEIVSTILENIKDTAEHLKEEKTVGRTPAKMIA